MALQPCRWRGPLIQEELFPCHHPRVHAPDRLVSRDVCDSCRHGGGPEPLVADPPDVPKVHRNVSTWAVGVTTAPRRQATLNRCLTSLAEAGWPAPRLFAEPHVEVPAELPISRRDARLGAFPNWYLGLTELYLREPHANAYFLCQDDVLLATGLRGYLEQTLWPAPRVGVVSVYCPSHYAARSQGYQEENRGWDSWGALAYVFPNPSVRAFLSDPRVLNHRHHGQAEGQRNIDSVVGQWCLHSGLPYFVHVPSLAQHIGETSTIWRHGGASGPRQAAEFRDNMDESLPLNVEPHKSSTASGGRDM